MGVSVSNRGIGPTSVSSPLEWLFLAGSGSVRFPLTACAAVSSAQQGPFVRPPGAGASGAASARRQSISSRRHSVTPFGIEMLRQRRSARETGSGLRPSSSSTSQRSMALRTARAPAERMGSGGR